MPLEPCTALPAPLGRVTLLVVYKAAGSSAGPLQCQEKKSCGSSARSFSTTVPWYNYKARFIQGHFPWGFSKANMKLSGCCIRIMVCSPEKWLTGTDCEDRWWFCTELEPELSFSYIEDFSLSLLPSVHQRPNRAVLHQRGCLPGYWEQELLAQPAGSSTWCSWNLGVTLMLPRCCGCLRISQQFFLLFLEASSNTVPLGATRGLLLPSSSGAKRMDCLFGCSLFYWLVSSMSEDSYFHLPTPDEVWWRTGLFVRLPYLATLWPAQLVEVPFSSVTCWDVPLV